MNTQEIRSFAEEHKPVFVVGMERGGTSILTKTLASAPCFGSFKGGQETFAFDKPEAMLERSPQMMTKVYLGGGKEWNEFCTWYDGLADWPEDWMEQRRMVTAYFYYASQVANDGARVIEKTPRHVFQVPRIKRFFPNARIIAILRNPLGVIESYKKRLDREMSIGTKPEYYNWLDRTPNQICAHIDKIADAAYKAKENFPNAVMLTSYEETLRDPELVFRLIGDFAEIDGIKVNAVDKAPEGDLAKSDPLLQAGGIVQGNAFETSLDIEERMALVKSYPKLFARTTGMFV